MTPEIDTQAIVVGTGPAGLACALALAKGGVETILTGPAFDPDPPRPDTRTAALLTASVTLVRNLGAWRETRAFAAPLRAIRIIDATGRTVRAPTVEFRASELGRTEFGFNVANRDLVEALFAAVQSTHGVSFRPTAGVTEVVAGETRATVVPRDGEPLSARLVVGADGRNSVCREGAGITGKSWDYPQTALAFNFTHALPHEFVSNEFHFPAGPFTTVPLADETRSSLVWVETPERARHLMDLDDAALGREMEAASQGLLGGVCDIGPRAAFPLSGLNAYPFGGNRIALVGEAAHVIPPIGAQGLNLGFRDVAVLADCIAAALADDGDIGGDTVLSRYAHARSSDVFGRTVAVDVLNRSLLSAFLPFQAARGLALHALDAIGPLRRMVMRAGLTQDAGLPSLMRA